MKKAVTKVIETLTQDDFHGALQKLLERYNKCIAARGDNFMCVLSIKGGDRGVVVIVVGNGHGDTSSNPGRD